MRLGAVLLIFIFALIPLNAAFGSSPHITWMGSLFLFASDNGPSADPPAILPSLGVSASWVLQDPLKIEVTGDFYGTNYEYNTVHNYPMACSPESRSAFVFGLVTAVQVTGYFPIGDNGTTVRVYGGPAADFRLVVPAFGLHPDDQTGDIDTNAKLQTEAIASWFWSDGRWIMPVFGAGMDFPLNEQVLLGFDLRVWFPVYKLWTNDNTPAIDGWRFGLGLRVTPRRKS